MNSIENINGRNRLHKSSENFKIEDKEKRTSLSRNESSPVLFNSDVKSAAEKAEKNGHVAVKENCVNASTDYSPDCADLSDSCYDIVNDLDCDLNCMCGENGCVVDTLKINNGTNGVSSSSDCLSKAKATSPSTLCSAVATSAAAAVCSKSNEAVQLSSQEDVQQSSVEDGRTYANGEPIDNPMPSILSNLYCGEEVKPCSELNKQDGNGLLQRQNSFEVLEDWCKRSVCITENGGLAENEADKKYFKELIDYVAENGTDICDTVLGEYQSEKLNANNRSRRDSFELLEEWCLKSEDSTCTNEETNQHLEYENGSNENKNFCNKIIPNGENVDNFIDDVKNKFHSVEHRAKPNSSKNCNKFENVKKHSIQKKSKAASKMTVAKLKAKAVSPVKSPSKSKISKSINSGKKTSVQQSIQRKNKKVNTKLSQNFERNKSIAFNKNSYNNKNIDDLALTTFESADCQQVVEGTESEYLDKKQSVVIEGVSTPVENTVISPTIVPDVACSQLENINHFQEAFQNKSFEDLDNKITKLSLLEDNDDKLVWCDNSQLCSYTCDNINNVNNSARHSGKQVRGNQSSGNAHAPSNSYQIGNKSIKSHPRKHISDVDSVRKSNEFEEIHQRDLKKHNNKASSNIPETSTSVIPESVHSDDFVNAKLSPIVFREVNFVASPKLVQSSHKSCSVGSHLERNNTCGADDNRVDDLTKNGNCSSESNISDAINAMQIIKSARKAYTNRRPIRCDYVPQPIVFEETNFYPGVLNLGHVVNINKKTRGHLKLQPLSNATSEIRHKLPNSSSELTNNADMLSKSHVATQSTNNATTIPKPPMEIDDKIKRNLMKDESVNGYKSKNSDSWKTNVTPNTNKNLRARQASKNCRQALHSPSITKSNARSNVSNSKWPYHQSPHNTGDSPSPLSSPLSDMRRDVLVKAVHSPGGLCTPVVFKSASLNSPLTRSTPVPLTYRNGTPRYTNNKSRPILGGTPKSIKTHIANGGSSMGSNSSINSLYTSSSSSPGEYNLDNVSSPSEDNLIFNTPDSLNTSEAQREILTKKNQQMEKLREEKRKLHLKLNSWQPHSGSSLSPASTRSASPIPQRAGSSSPSPALNSPSYAVYNSLQALHLGEAELLAVTNLYTMCNGQQHAKIIKKSRASGRRQQCSDVKEATKVKWKDSDLLTFIPVQVMQPNTIHTNSDSKSLNGEPQSGNEEQQVSRSVNQQSDSSKTSLDSLDLVQESSDTAQSHDNNPCDFDCNTLKSILKIRPLHFSYPFSNDGHGPVVVRKLAKKTSVAQKIDPSKM